MKCPVCPIDPVPEGASACPGCGTDVSPLRRLEGLGAALCHEAAQLARDSALDEAITRACGALTADGRNVEARKLLGKLWWRKGRVCEALKQWEQAAALASDDRQLKDLIAFTKRHLRRRALFRAGLVVAVLVAAVSLGFLFRAAWPAIVEALTANHGASQP